jgi:hypothetical protein
MLASFGKRYDPYIIFFAFVNELVRLQTKHCFFAPDLATPMNWWHIVIYLRNMVLLELFPFKFHYIQGFSTSALC